MPGLMGSLLLLLAGGMIAGNALEAGQSFLCAGVPAAEHPLPPTGAAKPAQVVHSRTTGTRRALVLFARFKGESTPLPSWSGDIFKPDLPGSFSHFYDTMSFGKLQVRGEVAPRVYESAQSASAYLADDQTPGDEFGQFSLEILRQADQDLDFSQFDNNGPDGIPNSGDDDGVVDAVLLVLNQVPRDFLLSEATGIARLGFTDGFLTDDTGAGGIAIQIAPGQGTIQQGRFFAEAVGAMCHEYGHMLGLPDLYNTEFLGEKGVGPEEDSAGVGAWCLMGWGASGWNGNDGPNSFCAWSRMKLGWTKVRAADRGHQEIRLAEVGKRGEVVRVPLTGQEYFLLEHRRRTSTYYDRNIPGEGLLIWHVGTQRREGELTSQLVLDLECADGRWTDAGYPVGKAPDPQKGEDNLDFWAHDVDYARVHRGNLGDATDPFDGVRFTAFTPQTNPASYNEEGWLSAQIEGIRLDGGDLVAQVEVAPLVVEVKNLALFDEDRDKIVLAEERLSLSFALANTGGLAARDLKTRLTSEDPWVEIEQAESSFQDLEPGHSSFGAPTGGFPSLRMRGGFIGTHQARVVLEVYAGETLIGQRELEVVGISPRQQVSRVAILDSLGNGDGLAQGGEFISLQVELAQVEQPAPLQLFDFLLWPLQQQVVAVSAPRVSFDRERLPARSTHSPEFLLPVGLEPGTKVEFVFEVRGSFSSFKDTLSVEIQPGTDTTPPRVMGIQTRLVAGGVHIWLPASQVLEGGAVRKATAWIYTLEDTVEVVEVPLQWRDKGYEGTWMAAAPGTYLLEGVVEDMAGNRGHSRLHGFPVLKEPGSASAPRSSAWEEIALPHEGHRPYISNLMRAPGNPEVLYASGTQGTWRSVDDGASWDRLGFFSGSLLIDAADPFTLYTWIDALLKSRDGGDIWQELGVEVIPLAADPVRPGRLYGYQIAQRRLVVSADGGESWQATSLEVYPYPLLIHPTVPQVLYVGGTSQWDRTQAKFVLGDLWRSADGGESWIKKKMPRDFFRLVPDPRSPEGLYATSRDTLWHSGNGGDTWEVVQVLGWKNVYATVLKVHPLDPRTLFLAEMYGGRDSRMAVSHDAGQTWEQFSAPYGIADLFLHPRDQDKLHLAVYSFREPVSLIQTSDGGEHWEPVYLPETNPAVGTVLFDQEGQLYAGSGRMSVGESGNILPGFYRSADRGRQWTWEGYKLEIVGGGIYYSESQPIVALHLDPFEPQTILAVLSGLLVRSIDGGRYWKSIPGISGNAYASIIADRRRAGIYYFAAAGVWRSEDFGETWESRSAGLPRRLDFGIDMEPSVNAMMLDAQQEPARLCAAIGDSLWQSTDEGQHWEYTGKVKEGEYIYVLATPPLEEQRLYAATSGGFYVSEDRGRTWVLLSALRSPKVRLRFDPHDPQRFLLVTGPQLLEARDGGKTWKPIGADLGTGAQFNDAAVDPLAPNLIYVATNGGLYRLDTDQLLTAVEEEPSLPATFSLSPNYPNPFNPTTTLRFSLPQQGEAELAIYNLLGQRVATLVKGMQEAGSHVLQWDGRDDAGRELASGVYCCRLQAGTQVETRKLLLLR